MQLLKTKKMDPVLLSVVVLLLVFGLVMISSAGVALSKAKFNDEYYFFKHQLIHGVIPGLILMLVVQKIHYEKWKKVAFPLFLFSVLLLILVFVPPIGMYYQGASRWIRIGTFSFQPAEMMKLSILLYLAVWFESRSKKLKDFQESFIPFSLILASVAFLIVKQPDLGTLGSIVCIAISMFFVSGVPIRFVFGIVGAGVLLLALLIKLEPYRLGRLMTFMNPEYDPQGIGYQINQALLAIGSGGVWGLGLGHSRQKFNYLPEPIGDSIFAIICEELGMAGATLLLVLFLLFAMRGYKIAKNAPDMFSRLIAVGITSWIIFQALINIMAIVGLIPLTGVTLPFISYGSTSLIFLMIATGILLNISKHSKMD
jgi:cell division protein FtsW